MSRKINESHFNEIIKQIGEDPKREGLIKTPKRAASAFEFLTQGYTQDIDNIVNGAVFESEESDELILVNDIEFYSLCEHHMLPFSGYVSVGYIPTDKIIGLSKIPRIVDVFARRLQIQERMTTQIAETITQILDPKGVGVIISAQHMCMSMRGVNKQAPYMQTSALTGVFRDANNPAPRAEFLQLVSRKGPNV